MGDLDRALECLRRERRDCAHPPAADSAIVPSHVDRAHPAAAGADRHRARDLSRRRRSEPARPARRRSGAVAADARQRAPGARTVRGGAAVSAGGGGAVRAARGSRCRKPRCGAASLESSSGRRRPRRPRRGMSSWRCSARAATRKSELEAREGLARAMRANGPDEAIPAFESALALAATIGERAREAAIRNTLGILEWERGGYAAALRHYESALALVRAAGQARRQEAVILNSLGVSPDEARPARRGAHRSRREPGAQSRDSASVSSKRTRWRRSVTSSRQRSRSERGAADWFEQSRARAPRHRRSRGRRLDASAPGARSGSEIGDIAGAVADGRRRGSRGRRDRRRRRPVAACAEAAQRRPLISDQEKRTNAPLHHRTIRSGSHA